MDSRGFTPPTRTFGVLDPPGFIPATGAFARKGISRERVPNSRRGFSRTSASAGHRSAGLDAEFAEVVFAGVLSVWNQEFCEEDGKEISLPSSFIPDSYFKLKAEWEVFMNPTVSISLPEKRIGDFCRTHRIRKMWLYGSALTKRFRPDSDVDILVEFQDGLRPDWHFFSLNEELEPIWGRKVDLHTPDDFRPSRRSEILSQAKLIYEA